LIIIDDFQKQKKKTTWVKLSTDITWQQHTSK